jgi:hypothetical protein
MTRSRKLQVAEIFPNDPTRVLPAGGQKFFLLVGNDVGFPVSIHVRDSQRVQRTIALQRHFRSYACEGVDDLHPSGDLGSKTTPSQA